MSPLPPLSDYLGNPQRLRVNTCSEEHEIRPSVDFGLRGGFFYFQIPTFVSLRAHVCPHAVPTCAKNVL